MRRPYLVHVAPGHDITKVVQTLRERNVWLESVLASYNVVSIAVDDHEPSVLDEVRAIDGVTSVRASSGAFSPPLERPITELDEEGLLAIGCRRWHQDTKLMLLPVSLYHKIPDGTELFTIDGQILIKGVDRPNMDTRGGLLAFGIVPKPSSPPAPTGRLKAILSR